MPIARIPPLRPAFRAVLIWLLAIGFAACTPREQEPARQAIADVENAVAAAGTEPARYIPVRVREVEDGLGRLKQAYEHGDYGKVLADAPATLAAAQALAGEADARRIQFEDALAGEWEALSVSVPADLERFETRYARLVTGRDHATGSSDDQADAGRRLQDARSLWQRAQTQHAAAHLPEAVTLANQSRDLLIRIAPVLGLPPPVAAVK